MKKTFIGLAVLAMSLMPAAAMAQNQSKATDEKAKTEKVDNKKHPRKDKSERGDFRGKGGKHKPGKKNPGVCREQCIFEALNLTEDQKAKVKSLNEAREVSRREMFEQVKKTRAMNDSSLKAAKNHGKDIDRKYLNDLTSILTADQYIQFLETNYVESRGGKPKGDGDRMVKSGKMVREPKGAKRAKAEAKVSADVNSNIKASTSKNK